MIQKLGIVGLGLIGGSLAKAARHYCGVPEIVAYNRHTDVLEAALAEGVIDRATTQLDETFANCDVIVLCTPVAMLYPCAKALLPYLSPQTILTDVGSVKGELMAQMEALSGQVTFVGGHPMTGSERSRYPASRPHLFENAYYLFTPTAQTPDWALTTLTEFAAQIGAIPITLSPAEHDHAVAAISHLPHVVAAGLVNYVKQADTAAGVMHLLAAGGFRDLTRIASSSPEMWDNICTQNREEILEAIAALETVLADFKQKLARHDSPAVYEYFAVARDYRDSFSFVTPGQHVERYGIAVDIQDRPGSIALIAVLFSSHGINIKNMSIVNNREQMEGVLHIAFDSEAARQKSLALLRDLNYAAVAD